MDSTVKIGRSCKRYRKELGYTQNDVARDTGYTQQNISLFERGENDNCVILMWYIRHGMLIGDFETIKGKRVDDVTE